MSFEQNGVMRSTYDARDYEADASVVPVPSSPNAKTAMISFPDPPCDQADLPCCTSIATTTAMEALDIMTPPYERLSPLFHYYVSRPIKGSLRPISVREALSSAITKGVCALRYHTKSFSQAGALNRPSPQAYSDAKKRRLKGFDPSTGRNHYYRFPSPRDLQLYRRCLRAGLPVILVFNITNEYLKLSDVDTHGPVAGAPVGAAMHAVTAIGFADTQSRKALCIRDSRGATWGDGGCWWMPFSVVEAPWVIEEAWTVHAVTY